MKENQPIKSSWKNHRLYKKKEITWTKAQGRPTDKERKKPRRIAAPEQVVRGTAHVGCRSASATGPPPAPAHVGEPGRAGQAPPRLACRAGPTAHAAATRDHGRKWPRRDERASRARALDLTTRLVGPVNTTLTGPGCDRCIMHGPWRAPGPGTVLHRA